MFWPSLVLVIEKSVPAVHRCTERKAARGYAETGRARLESYSVEALHWENNRRSQTEGNEGHKGSALFKLESFVIFVAISFRFSYNAPIDVAHGKLARACEPLRNNFNRPMRDARVECCQLHSMSLGQFGKIQIGELSA
jgi:hypothetical protein